MRLRLDLSYDGAGFHGWARQPGLRTVQGEIESALATIFRTPGLDLTVAGRTDTGVHARGQVAHLDVPDELWATTRQESKDRKSPLNGPFVTTQRRLNGVLDPDVRIRAVTEAAEGFDARFSALWRRYCYRIADRAAYVDPLTRGHVLAWGRPLDENRMNEAAGLLLG
ncbi:MAG: tRNA pseudouridine(38-40) synthase TruA, partial [Myxococcales bacterium]